MATIPKVLHEHINTAFPANVCLVGTVLPNGFAQITPRGSTMVYDDEHLALWERGKGSTNANLRDKSKVTVYLRKPQLREAGVLPNAGPGLAAVRTVGLDSGAIGASAAAGALDALYLLHVDPLRDLPSRRTWRTALERATSVIAARCRASSSVISRTFSDVNASAGLMFGRT